MHGTEVRKRFGLEAAQVALGHSSADVTQVSNGSDPTRDWDQGYGFQFWRCRHGAYRGDGAFGQFCIVLPDYDAVIAITADTRDMQAELNVVWDKLLSAFHPDALPPTLPRRISSRRNWLT